MATSPAGFDNRKLFVLSVIALATAGISNAIQVDISDKLKSIFIDPIDAVHSAELTNDLFAVCFLGFAFTIAIGSPLLDFLGMGRLLKLSSLCFIVGTCLTIFTERLAGTDGHPYSILWTGMLLSGIGWGLVETVINPLTAALYPAEKTHKLNILHAWWPGGLIIGGIVSQAIGSLHGNWQLEYAVTLVPAVVFGAMTLGTRFPPTERAAHGVPARAMFKEVSRPFFILWFLCMFLTAASELAPQKWLKIGLSQTIHMSGTWILVYVSAIMFVMRHFAGPFAHRFSPVGLLWFSCLLASIGLLFLGYADSPFTGLLAATFWGVGVCYMWPTMLAAASERFPRGGALLMGLMGTGGTLSIWYLLPRIGEIFDYYKVKLVGGAEVFTSLADTDPKKIEAVTIASQMSFRWAAVLPAVLLIVFGLIWLRDRAKGGYKPVAIDQ